MANSSDDQNVPLTIFGGLVGDVDPIDLPAGASPDNSNVAYLPGKVGTRPALTKTYSPAVPADIVYLKTYVQPDEVPTTLLADANGNLYQEMVATAPGTYSPIPAPPPNPVDTVGLCESDSAERYIFTSYDPPIPTPGVLPGTDNDGSWRVIGFFGNGYLYAPGTYPRDGPLLTSHSI